MQLGSMSELCEDSHLTMWRRFLLLLLCVLLPLQSVRADEGADSLAHQGHHSQAPHAHHAHHAHGAEDVDQAQAHAQAVAQSDEGAPAAEHLSDHCVCPLGCLLPSGSAVFLREAAAHGVPGWTPPSLPTPVLPAPQRPPHTRV